MVRFWIDRRCGWSYGRIAECRTYKKSTHVEVLPVVDLFQESPFFTPSFYFMGDATQVEDKIKIVQILFSLVYICFFSQILGAFLVIVLIRHPPQAPRQVPEGNLTLFSLFFLNPPAEG